MADIIGSGNKKDKWTKKVTEWINWLNEKKQAKLVEGDNVTLTPLQDGTVKIDAGGGAAALDDLTDVDVSSVTDGQALVYDAQNDVWVAGEAGQVDDVVMNGNSIVTNKVASFKNYKEITRSQYDALPDTKYSDDILYCITDSGVKREGTYSPVIYSLAEREIGVYLDGKPLYQKTIVKPFDSNTWGYSFSYEHGIANIDSCVSFEGHYITSSGAIQGGRIDPASVDTADTELRKYIQGQNTMYMYQFSRTKLTWHIGTTWVIPQYMPISLIATVRYTKTTDNAGAGSWTEDGVPSHHYSTSEKVIGTWIDGKTLFEKTIVLPIVNNTSAGEVNYPHGIANVDKICYVYTLANRPRPYAGASYEYGVTANATNIQVEAGMDRHTSTLYITLRYTKTS